MVINGIDNGGVRPDSVTVTKLELTLGMRHHQCPESKLNSEGAGNKDGPF
jgi:hypothetical protein